MPHPDEQKPGHALAGGTSLRMSVWIAAGSCSPASAENLFRAHLLNW